MKTIATHQVGNRTLFIEEDEVGEILMKYVITMDGMEVTSCQFFFTESDARLMTQIMTSYFKAKDLDEPFFEEMEGARLV